MANIMIIDDKPYMSFLVSEDLSLEGHTIKCFEDVRAAMEEFDSNMPDIVLFDIYFKGSEGWDTLHSMKISYPDVPVIIVPCALHSSFHLSRPLTTDLRRAFRRAPMPPAGLPLHG